MIVTIVDSTLYIVIINQFEHGLDSRFRCSYISIVSARNQKQKLVEVVRYSVIFQRKNWGAAVLYSLT